MRNTRIRRGLILGLTVGLFYFVPNAMGEEYPHVYRGARTLGMGGSYIAIADDDNVLFLNPAGLGSGKVKSLDIVNVQVEVPLTSIMLVKDIMELAKESGTAAMEEGAVKLFDNNMGNPVGFGFSEHFNVIYKHFGIGVFVKTDVTGKIRNRVWPRVNFAPDAVGGAVVGFGYPFLDRKIQAGISGKMIFRGMTDESYTLARLSRAAGASGIEKEGNFLLPETVSPSLGGDMFLNVDLGVIYNFIGEKERKKYKKAPTWLSKLDPSVGVVMRDLKILDDIIDIRETTSSLTADFVVIEKSPEAIYPLTFNIGMAIHPRLWRFDTNVGLDFEDLLYNATNDKDFFKRFHLGGEVVIIDRWYFGFALRAGLNQHLNPLTNWTAGAKLKFLKVVEFEAASYAEEVGVEAGQFKIRRFVVRANIPI